MALASFGKPRYVDEFRDIVRLGRDGQYTIEPTAAGGAVRPGRGCAAARWSSGTYDIAHSLQVVLEETVLELARWLHQRIAAATTSAWPAAWR